MRALLHSEIGGYQWLADWRVVRMVSRGYSVNCYQVESTVLVNNHSLGLYLCCLVRSVQAPHAPIVLLASVLLGSVRGEGGVVRAIYVYFITYSYCRLRAYSFIVVFVLFSLSCLHVMRYNFFHKFYAPERWLVHM